MPAESGDLRQTTLWTLEDDFQGRSTPGTARRPQPANGAGQASTGPAGLDEQPKGELKFDGQTYTYAGYVLEEGRFVQRVFRFTPGELDIYPTEPLWRVAAMVDATGRDAARQAENKRYGKRVWHCCYRTQDAAMQGLDYIFRHDVDLVLGCHPFAQAFYGADAAAADRWTMACYEAYRLYALYGSREPLCRLLADAGIPLLALGIDTDVSEEA